MKGIGSRRWKREASGDSQVGICLNAGATGSFLEIAGQNCQLVIISLSFTPGSAGSFLDMPGWECQLVIISLSFYHWLDKKRPGCPTKIGPSAVLEVFHDP